METLKLRNSPDRSGPAVMRCAYVVVDRDLMVGDSKEFARRAAATAIAVTAIGLVRLCVVLDRVAAAVSGPHGYPVWLYPFLVAAVTTPAAVGALLVWRLPSNPVAWILVVGDPLRGGR